MAIEKVQTLQFLSTENAEIKDTNVKSGRLPGNCLTSQKRVIFLDEDNQQIGGGIRLANRVHKLFFWLTQKVEVNFTNSKGEIETKEVLVNKNSFKKFKASLPLYKTELQNQKTSQLQQNVIAAQAALNGLAESGNSVAVYHNEALDIEQTRLRETLSKEDEKCKSNASVAQRFENEGLEFKKDLISKENKLEKLSVNLSNSELKCAIESIVVLEKAKQAQRNDNLSFLQLNPMFNSNLVQVVRQYLSEVKVSLKVLQRLTQKLSLDDDTELSILLKDLRVLLVRESENYESVILQNIEEVKSINSNSDSTVDSEDYAISDADTEEDKKSLELEFTSHVKSVSQVYEQFVSLEQDNLFGPLIDLAVHSGAPMFV